MRASLFRLPTAASVFTQVSLALATVWLGACSPNASLEELDNAGLETASQEGKKTAIAEQTTFTQPGLYPEGSVLDEKNNRFLVSSFAQGTIGAVNFDGTYTPFIVDSRLVATVGLTVDKARNRVLVAVADPTQGNLAALGIYDLTTGSPLQFVNLGQVSNTTANFANDIALDPQGNAYVTNSFSPVIYKVDPSGNATVFFQDPAFATPAGAFGFNGIVYDNRGYLLVALTSSSQILRIPVREPAAYSLVELDAPLLNPDGLLLSQDGKQLVVVNNAFGAAAGNVQSFLTTNQWATGQLAATFRTGPVFPTTATSDGKNIYVLYSYLNQLLSGDASRATYTIQRVDLAGNRPF
ncbi:hypothetical protein MTX78_19870 [Hymenobacter tibetensis]|uniref:SMP-30/Gluconolactonase/LRE-like region domain-containing protein n=1 Tax=Hymenobacter tibetensis TaxID=497967 RepID=A0ABY4D333_9BACT|nr:hypothetical protein [Hymenobacter tibetensis]UOG74363.1 hypothetical protein MTX78_19870 [Hymenobacter tibetensis]